MMVLYALLIFVVFAVVGGAIVWFLINNQDPEDGSSRGFPQDSAD